MGKETKIFRYFGFFGQRNSNSSPKLKSVSSCGNTTSGLHHFEILNYSLTKGRGIGTSIASSCFSVGGHDWRIRCYLDGHEEQNSDYISAFLQYCPGLFYRSEPRAKFSFSLLEHTSGAAVDRMVIANSVQFSSSGDTYYGWTKYIKRDKLEASSCLRDDSFTIICHVTVIGEPRTSVVKYVDVPRTVVNPSNLLGKPYRTHMPVGKVADMIFEVDGKSFAADSTVVASSSPVFRAQLSGLMKEGKELKIRISDMKAPVFEALLRYIYTKELPEINVLISTGMAQQLLVASERFGMDNLWTNCERILSDGLNTQTVCTVLALAEQCRLIKLKSTCLKYLSAPEALVSAMATEGYIHLVQSYPSILRR